MEERVNAVSTVDTFPDQATSVKLLIKSSNQQYDDQIIESDMMWTVKRLKLQLSIVYPSKPPVAEQKLIYSGQLLDDKLLLKNVLRSYKDVYTHNHIIHLVYTPRVAPTQSFNVDSTKKVTNNMTNEGSAVASGSQSLRQRYVNGSNSTMENQQSPQQLHQQQQQLLSQNQFINTQNFTQMSGGNILCPPLLGTELFSMSSHEMAAQLMARQQTAMQQWMQQVYTQYMEQYTRLFSPNGQGATSDDNIVNNVSSGIWSTNSYLPYMSHVLNAGNLPFPVIAQSVSQGEETVSAQPTPMLDSPAAGGGAAVGEGRQEGGGDGGAAEQRFPLIAQEDLDNRDWLDSFFSITRLAIFLTILYFNSSPMRCLAVLIIASFIYLYHIGVLRFNRERNNNIINRNNNDNSQVRQGVQQEQNEDETSSDGEDVDDSEISEEPVLTAEVVTNNSNNANEATTSTATVEAETNSLHYMVRTFVITFFTSLLPETHAI